MTNDSLSSWTFHFLAGVIYMIETKTAEKKTKWLTYSFWEGEGGGGNGLDYIYVVGSTHPEVKALSWKIATAFPAGFTFLFPLSLDNYKKIAIRGH